MESRRNITPARRLRRDMTDAEQLLWRHLRNRELLGHKFRRQHAIGGYIVDFVCIEARLIVEADGGQHVDDSDKDAERTRRLEEIGYRVMRFWNDDVLLRVEDVLEAVIEGPRAHPHPNPLPPAGEGAALW
jgi:very-short-patch-repair endonuclease